MNYLWKSKASGLERDFSFEDQQEKIIQVRSLLGPVAEALPYMCSDESVSRYLRARNWNVEKSSKMLKETLKWRLKYKPESIRWEEVSLEAETGKTYRANYLDKYGRTVLVLRPGFQNTSSLTGQIKYLVYCMENAIMNLAADQEQMGWLIDFERWTMGSVSVTATRETTHILQNYYPERLGFAILYNPPKVFEKFWKVVRPFLDNKTFKKVKFVYSDNLESQKIMSDLFDMDKLDSSFGGRNEEGFDFHKYSEQMKLDDQKMSEFLNSNKHNQQIESSVSEVQSEASSYSTCSSDTESHTAENIKHTPETVVNGKQSAIVESEVQADLIHLNKSA